MQRYIVNTLLIIAFLVILPLTSNAQDSKIDFTATWKSDSLAVIVVEINKGVEPFTFYVYDGSPFKNGKQIGKLENITTKTFEFTIDKKIDVFVYLFKDEMNYSGKWLKINE